MQFHFCLEYKKGSHNQKNCDFEELPNAEQVCKLDISKFDECTSENRYGYAKSAPCIFLKLNRIYGWEPEYYNDPNDLPADMPIDLKDHIKGLPDTHRNQIWVSCRGEEGSDREILGDILYYPQRGFPSYFYPYTNTIGYVSPLVAVKFTRPARKLLVFERIFLRSKHTRPQRAIPKREVILIKKNSSRPKQTSSSSFRHFFTLFFILCFSPYQQIKS